MNSSKFLAGPTKVLSTGINTRSKPAGFLNSRWSMTGSRNVPRILPRVLWNAMKPSARPWARLERRVNHRFHRLIGYRDIEFAVYRLPVLPISLPEQSVKSVQSVVQSVLRLAAGRLRD